MIIKLFILFITAYTVQGVRYNDLRVKFGWSGALENKENFFKIPRTQRDAEDQGWKRTDRPVGPIPDLRMYCPLGRYVCPLYDSSGFVAGLQIALPKPCYGPRILSGRPSLPVLADGICEAIPNEWPVLLRYLDGKASLPVDEYEPLAMKPEKRLVKWRAAAGGGEPTRDYWTATQYYVTEDALLAGAGPQIENGGTLQDNGVWVNGLNGKLMRIPLTEVELNNTDFKKQNCIPNMGTHYYYNMTKELRCEETLPWFALTSGGVMVGTGLQVFGRMNPKEGQRDWFERPPERAVQVTIPFAPPCLHEWVANYGVVSIHIYYVEKPWKIRCSTGDSAKPAPALDRLILNGERYATQVVDEIKKLFTI